MLRMNHYLSDWRGFQKLSCSPRRIRGPGREWGGGAVEIRGEGCFVRGSEVEFGKIVSGADRESTVTLENRAVRLVAVSSCETGKSNLALRRFDLAACDEADALCFWVSFSNHSFSLYLAAHRVYHRLKLVISCSCASGSGFPFSVFFPSLSLLGWRCRRRSIMLPANL